MNFSEEEAVDRVKRGEGEGGVYRPHNLHSIEFVFQVTIPPNIC